MNSVYLKFKLNFTLIAILAALGIASLNAQTLPDFEWAAQIGGSKADSGMSVTVSDDASNAYVSGSFSEKVDFGKVGFASAGGTDIFITQLDVASGSVTWTQQMGGADNDQSTSVAVDGKGNVYATGYFSGSATFGKQTLTSAGGTDIFLVKLDANGNIQWAQRMGGTGNDRGNAVKVTDAGDIYVTGYFNAPEADFGKTTLTSNGVEDIFVARLNTNGDYTWVYGYGGTGTDEGNAIAVDKDGNPVITGIFNDKVVFSSKVKNGTVSSKGGSDVFIYKMDANGNYSWIKSFGSTTNDNGTSIAFDPWGNVLTTGYFTNEMDFDPGTGIHNLTPAGTTSGINGLPADVFVSKLDGKGNFDWAKQIGGTLEDRGYSVAVDALGSVYTTGYFQSNPADFDPGTGVADTFNLMAAAPAFVSKLDSAGDFLWVRSWGNRTPGIVFGTSAVLTIANAIAVDKAFNVYTTGRFILVTGKKINLYPGPTKTGDSLMFASNGAEDIFVHKMSQEIKIDTCKPTSSIVKQDGCDSLTINGQTYYKSGTYTQTVKNAGGCDSTITLYLAINSSTMGNIVETACDSFTLNGQTYTASGHYTQFFSKGNATGCDSTLSIDLTINKSTASDITKTACSSYTWGDSTYTQTGTYTQTLKTVTGCDSVVTLNLTINTIDTTVEEVGDHTLKAAVLGASYQWLNCDDGTAITGAISQSFTPNVDGNYAVAITLGDCSDTSSCYNVEVPTGVSEKNWSHSIQLYPNPVKEQLTVRSGVALDNVSFRIVDVVGRVMIKNNKLSGKLFQVNVSGLVPGIYFIEINGSGPSYRIKFVKE